MNQKEHIACIQKRLDDARVVWFKNSGSFTLLEEPALDIFRLYLKGASLQDIIEYYKNNYFSENEEDIYCLITRIIKNINRLNQANIQETPELKSVMRRSHSSKEESTHQYAIDNEQITIRYSHTLVKDLIHPLFAHLETANSREPQYTIHLIYFENQFVIRQEDETLEVFDSHESNYFKGSVLKLLYSILYKKMNTSWMMTLHASGIITGDQAVLFMAGSGSGKSTLAALLYAGGYRLLSDDFVAADENAKVYPFPAAISVKNGAVDVLSRFYPELSTVPAKKNHKGLQTRFLPLQQTPAKIKQGHKIKAVVFLKYDQREKLQYSSVSKKEAIQLLLKETWVNPLPNNVARFLDWAAEVPFYKLTYNHTSPALKSIKKLLDES